MPSPTAGSGCFVAQLDGLPALALQCQLGMFIVRNIPGGSRRFMLVTG